jgi:YVTN family beta-propeller protein
MITGRFALTISVSLFLFGCGDETAEKTLCPATNVQGPALASGQPYLLVVNGLSEEWMAARVDSSGLIPLSKRGLTGESPNDMDVNGNLLYVVNSGDNTISIIDLATGITVGCIDVGSGANPWEFSVDPSDSTRGWVTTFLSGDLLELDLNARSVLRRKHVGPAMEGLFVTESEVSITLTGFLGAEGRFENGTVVTFQKHSLEEIHRHPVPPNPQFIFEGADDRFHVVCTGNYDTGPAGVPGQIVRIESDWSAVRDTLVVGGSPARATLGPDGTAFVAAFYGGVMTYDSVAFTLGAPVLTDAGFTAIAADGNTLYAANFELDAVAILDAASRTVTGELLVGDGPGALALYP